ncbi:MAG TPA: hypothetical protein VIL35_15025 [Vicinamibacterales bacterium]
MHGSPVRLCRGEAVVEYFRELVEDAVDRQQIGVGQMTSYYVVQLLAAFARRDAPASESFWSDAPLGTTLCQALETGGQRQKALLRQVGDASLFLSGFFPDRLRRSLVDVDYYMRLGGFAYGSLSRDESDALSRVFGELAEHFAAFVEVLGEISEKSALTSTNDLLRLYERWLRTGSTRVHQHLVRHGVLPTSATPRLVQ